MEEELACGMEVCPLSFIINWDRNKQVALSTRLMKEKMNKTVTESPGQSFERYQKRQQHQSFSMAD